MDTNSCHEYQWNQIHEIDKLFFSPVKIVNIEPVCFVFVTKNKFSWQKMKKVKTY